MNAGLVLVQKSEEKFRFLKEGTESNIKSRAGLT